MAEAAVSFAIKTIGNLLIAEAKSFHGMSDQVEHLKLELDRMQSCLKDAYAKQHDEERIKVWISQASDLAYEAEDLIEGYAFKVGSRRTRGIRTVLKKCVCISSEYYATREIGAEIQTLRTKISNLIKSLPDYGITAMMEREGDSSPLEYQLRRTYSHVIDDHFVGLFDDVELLVKKLVMENEICNFRSVSIYGMGGSGKSTIAKKVYHHPGVKRSFDGFAWVCVSQKWQKQDILQQILISLIPGRREEILKWRDEELVRQLFQIQQEKKYLLVLDDIWSAEAWECIKQAFPSRKDGSKILLTTRNKNVGLQIDPHGFHHQLRLLGEDESWELLQMKAFKERCDEDHEEKQEFEKFGKEMAKACGGLPLALIVLGGILATKKSLKEWEMVSKNIKVHLGRGNNLIQEEGNVSKILALSYYDLPHKLKPCFLYLSKFKEDSNIKTETLYQLWIAEGMISMRDRVGEESMMDVAERYLGELVQRCMVQGKAPDVPSTFRYFESCRLHDLMRDLSLLKAKEENFMLSISNDDEMANISSSTHQQIYRLAIHSSGKDEPKFVALEKRITRHLRSLAIYKDDKYEAYMSPKMQFQFNQLKMLRVLAFEGNFSGGNSKLVKAVDKLIHLRYLSLSVSKIGRLSSSIGNLQHLQTLDLRAASLARIPNVLWKMKELRHLFLPYGYFQPEMVKWNMFRKLRLRGLNKLEILKNFCIPFGDSEDISKLKNLRAFSAEIYVDFVDPTEIIGYISNSEHLRHTFLHIRLQDRSSYDQEKLSTAVGQFLSCHNLQELVVSAPIRSLSKYKANLSSALTQLRLEGSKIIEDPMETLQMLPNLWSLALGDDAFVGKEMRCTQSGFPQLRRLYLVDLTNLEKWWIDEGAMPNLSKLFLRMCAKLEMIPAGLTFITSLQDLDIVNMPKEFTDRIQVVGDQKGEDFDKISHIPSVRIRSY